MNSEVTLSNQARTGQPVRVSEAASIRGSVLRGIVLLLLCAVLPQASRADLIWENAIGNPLTSFLPDATDGLETVDLNTQYTFQGTPYSSISVATSGFIWLGPFSNGAQCCILSDPNSALTAFEQGTARIAPGWADLRPDQGGSIDFNQISDADGIRTVLTYLDVPTTNPSNSTARVSFQLQLLPTGEIIFSYKQFDWTSLGANSAAVIGLTPGEGLEPQNVDFTSISGSPLSTTSEGLYDYLSLKGNPGLNLAGNSLIFSPNPTGSGWLVSSAAAPEPSTFVPAAGSFFLLAVIRIRQKGITKCKV